MSGTMFVKRNPIRETTAGKNGIAVLLIPVFFFGFLLPVALAVVHIRVGSYYEIDSSILPQGSPEQLKSIRVVMVGKITASDVSLRYPSMYSLRSHFDCSRNNRNKPQKKRNHGGLLPVFDESHVMASELAGDLLYRRIAPHEVSMNRNSWSFWVSSASLRRNKMISQPAYNTRLCRASSPEGKCWSELRSGGMIKCGRRLRVQYKSRHIEYEKKNKEGEDDSRVKDEEPCKEEMEEDDDDGNETEGTREIGNETSDGNRKRKLIESSTTRLAQKAKIYDQKKENQIMVYKRRAEKNFIDRWSVDRYKLAEKNMLKVMKEKNAVFGNSILRSELRSEARKMIGDTGLLDHLLKHMAGNVAPGGQDRFMRRHNADGAMEYWLESSDLIHLRKEAGVAHPYWTPPPGWKLGDNPTQDPVCPVEIREIREELASLKRELEKLGSKKEEEELVIMTTPNSCVTSQNVDHDNLMTPAKGIYADLLEEKYKIEDQLVIIGETLLEMEEEMGWLKKTVDENFPRKPNTSETPLLLEDSPKIKTLEGEVKEVNNKLEELRRHSKTIPVHVYTNGRPHSGYASLLWLAIAVAIIGSICLWWCLKGWSSIFDYMNVATKKDLKDAYESLSKRITALEKEIRVTGDQWGNMIDILGEKVDKSSKAYADDADLIFGEVRSLKLQTKHTCDEFQRLVVRVEATFGHHDMQQEMLRKIFQEIRNKPFQMALPPPVPVASRIKTGLRVLLLTEKDDEEKGRSTVSDECSSLNAGSISD